MSLGPHGGWPIEGVSGGVPVPVSVGGLPASTGSHGGAVVEGLSNGTPIPTSDAGPAAGAGAMQLPVHQDFSTAAAVTPNEPTSGQKWVITDIFISTAAAAEVQLQEETSATVVFGPLILPANFAGQFTPRGKLKMPTADRKVMGKSSTADHVTIQVSVVSEA